MKRIWCVIILVCAAIAGAVAWMMLRKSTARGLVPKDATAVAVLNMRRMVDDFGISRSQVTDIDNKTGLDFTLPVYLFMTRNGYACLAATVSDIPELENDMKEKRQRRGYTYGLIGGFMACHDGSKVLMAGPLASWRDEALMDYMASLMSDGHQSCEMLDSVESGKSMFSARVSMAAMPAIAQNVVVPFLPKGVSLRDISMDFTAEAREDRVRLNVGLNLPDERITSFFRKKTNMLRPVEGGLLALAPESPVIWATANCRGGELLEKLREHKAVRTALLAMNLSVDLDMMIRAVDGDVALSVPRVGLHSNDYLLQATLKNTDFLRNADDWCLGEGHMVSRRGMTDFLFEAPDMPVYFGTENTAGGRHLLYGTNRLKYVPQHFQQFVPANMMGVSKADVSGADVFVTLDMKSLVKTVGPMIMMMGYGQNFYDFLSMLLRMNVRLDDDATHIDVIMDRPVKEIVEQWKE